jgi:ribosomal protein S6--L-glutamate ligase
MLLLASVSWSTGRIDELGVPEAARERRHQVAVIDLDRPVWHVPDPAGVDIVVARYANDPGGVALAHRFEGCPYLNRPWAIRIASDHWSTLEVLAAAGIPHAESRRIGPADGLGDAFAALGRPLVIKRPDSSGGRGVYLVASEDEYEAIRLVSGPGPYVAQRFYSESEGVDLRALVLRGEVVASARRRAASGEWRANVERGGTLAPWRLTRSEIEMAVGASAAVGLDLVGVDMLQTNHGSLVIETNAKPGVRTARTCGFPIGRELVVCAEDIVRGDTPWRRPDISDG